MAETGRKLMVRIRLGAKRMQNVRVRPNLGRSGNVAAILKPAPAHSTDIGATAMLWAGFLLPAALTCSVLRTPTPDLPPVANIDQQPRLSGSQTTQTQMAESSALTQAAAVDRADSQSEKWPSASSKVDDINSLCRRLTLLASS